MQDDFDVQFCDLCGTSVPLADLERGDAVRHQAKTIGACCLAVLRRGDSPLASPGLPGPPPAAPGRRASGELGLLPMAIALAVAMTAATIYLDLKIRNISDRQVEYQEDLSSKLGSSSDVLVALDQSMDGAVRKTDVETLRERFTALDDALRQQAELLREQNTQLRQAVAGVRDDVAKLAAQRIDYRPLFDDLRQQTQRLAAAINELQRTALPAVPVEAAAPPETPSGAPTAPGLSPELAEQVARLEDPDAAVRFEAVDQLLVSKNLAVLPNLVPMTRDSDGFVRRLTVEGLRDFRHPAAVEALLDALGDGDQTVADTAWSSLKKLTGQKIPFDAAAPNKDARARAQQRWREWWDKNKDTFGS